MFRQDFGRCPLDHTELSAFQHDVLLGTTLADRYVIEGCVGEGGMGRVYRARHRNLDRLFAVKVLYGDLAASGKMRQRFEREARAASRVDHPHLVSVLDSGATDSGLLYLVMTYVEGRELGQIVEDEAPLAAERVHRLVRQLCQGLAHAHDLGLVHRDFKGQNVLVSGTGEEEHARILDFGLAFMREEPESSRLTTEGVVMGTPAYMSPEQATGSELDHRTDLFSLGVLIYEMLSGKLPFEGTPVEIARQNLSATPPPIARRVPGLVVDPGLESMAHRLMQKLAVERFQSAQEIIAALDVLAAGDQDTHSVPALPAVAPASRPARPSQARPVAAPAADLTATVDTEAATLGMSQEPLPEPPTVPGTRARMEQRPLARRPVDVATERVRPGRRRPLAAAAIALVLVAGIAGGLALLGRGGGDAGLAAVTPVSHMVVPAAGATIDAGDTTAAAASDAGAPAGTVAEKAGGEAVDAADPAPPMGEPAQSRDAGAARQAQNSGASGAETGGEAGRDPGARRGNEAGGRQGRHTGRQRPGSPAEPAGAAAELEALYKRVGQKLAAFERERGAATARPFWDVYSSIPLLDALRTPSLGQEAMRTLRRLERDMAAVSP